MGVSPDTGIWLRIAEARKRARPPMTQEELARRLGISTPTLNRYETRNAKTRRPISAELLLRVAEETRCDPTWLFTGHPAAKTQVEQLGKVQEILTGLVAEKQAEYGMTNRQRRMKEINDDFDRREGVEPLRRVILDAYKAAGVPVEEIEKKYPD